MLYSTVMRVAVLSDVHGNLIALEAALGDLPPVDSLWCLGDVVGYGPWPNECIEALRSQRVSACVAGNHDRAAVGRLDTAAFNLEAAEAIRWTTEHLTADSRRWLDGLAERQERGQWTIVHGSPRYPIWEYLLDCYDAQPSFACLSTRYAFVGHTHVPAVFTLQGAQEVANCSSQPIVFERPIALGDARTIVNPGSVGQPRDGDPRASYVLLDENRGTVEYHRVAYDIARTQEQMSKVGLPARLAARLSYGL
jgi:predicted phosphodiesterase